jgi:hypothetical protein
VVGVAFRGFVIAASAGALLGGCDYALSRLRGSW